jgi:hypothetical protein
MRASTRGKLGRLVFVLAISLFLGLVASGVISAGQLGYAIRLAGHLVCPAGTRTVEVVAEFQDELDVYCIDDAGGGSIADGPALGAALFGACVTAAFAVVIVAYLGLAAWRRTRGRTTGQSDA